MSTKEILKAIISYSCRLLRGHSCFSLRQREIQLKLRKKKITAVEEHVREDRILIRPGVEEVLQMVSNHYQCGKEELIKNQRGENNEARSVAIYLSYRLGDYSQKELAKKFGLFRDRSISWHLRKIEGEIVLKRSLRKKVESIKKD